MRQPVSDEKDYSTRAPHWLAMELPSSDVLGNLLRTEATLYEQ